MKISKELSLRVSLERFLRCSVKNRRAEGLPEVSQENSPVYSFIIGFGVQKSVLVSTVEFSMPEKR